MKLSYFGSKFVERLRDTASTNLASYGHGSAWLEAVAGGERFIYESNLVVAPPPQLIISEKDNPKNDAENAKRVYLWLRGLTPALATEERLWAYLTHCVFPDYMKARWPASTVDLVVRRYLFEGRSFGALVRNGIARLWWGGYLTVDDTRQNEFELTETLFLRQEIQLALLDRSLGKCRKVRFSVLEFLRTNQDWLGAEDFGGRIQDLLLNLNLHGGSRLCRFRSNTASRSVPVALSSCEPEKVQRDAEPRGLVRCTFRCAIAIDVHFQFGMQIAQVKCFIGIWNDHQRMSGLQC